METDDDRQDDPKSFRSHISFDGDEFTCLVLFTLTIVYSYEEMDFILRLSSTCFLCWRSQTESIHLYYLLTHLYADASVGNLKPHKHFINRSIGKLFNLLKLAYPIKVSQKVRQCLKYITASCDHYAKHSVTPFRFRPSLSLEHISLNKELPIDLM